MPFELKRLKQIKEIQPLISVFVREARPKKNNNNRELKNVEESNRNYHTECINPKYESDKLTKSTLQDYDEYDFDFENDFSSEDFDDDFEF